MPVKVMMKTSNASTLLAVPKGCARVSRRNRPHRPGRRTLTGRLTRALGDLAKEDPEKYAIFWREFGPFLKEARVELPVLLDPEGRLVESVLKVRTMPTAFLIDRAGVVRSVHEGYDEARLPATLAEVEALLRE